MNRHSDVLESRRFQTYQLPPDKCMHLLTAQQTGHGPAQVLYKKQGGVAGRLGGGSFGSVQLEHIDSECEGQPSVRAVKTIGKAVANDSKIHWEQEIENLLDLSKFPELFVSVFGWWEDERFIYLSMEYFEAGDLSRCRDAIRGESDISNISRQLAQGLFHMHRLNIIHRDLKPQNVFVASQHPNWWVKIGDFGFSKRISESVSAPFSTRGTTRYMAPEYRDPLNNRETSDFTTAVDIWSFGCLIYELFTGKCPFDEDDVNTLKAFMQTKVFPRRPLESVEASHESISLLVDLLDPDSDQRLTAEQALESDWLRQDNTSPVRIEAPQDLATHYDNSSQLSIGGGGLTPRLAILGSSTPTLMPLPVPRGRALSNPESSQPPFDQHPTNITFGRDLQEALETANAGPEGPPSLPPRPRSATPSLISNTRSSEDLRNLPGSNHYHGSPISQSLLTSPVDAITKHRIARKPLPLAHPHLSKPMIRTLRSSDQTSIDMFFENIPVVPQSRPLCDVCESLFVLNPTIRQKPIFYCKNCGHRPLCLRCIQKTISNAGDPHEADHQLRAWEQAYKSLPPDLLQHPLALKVDSSGQADSELSTAFLRSDHAFAAPNGGHLTARWRLHVPPGHYELAIQIRTLPREEPLKSSVIGWHKKQLVKTKGVSLGSILVGGEAFGTVRGQANEAHGTPNPYLPPSSVEREVKFSENESTATMNYTPTIEVAANQGIDVHIRGSYDTSFFKAGCPFKWWLDSITITQTGHEKKVASMGDLIMRERAKERAAKLKRDQRIEKGIKYLGGSLGVVGQANAVRVGRQAKQSKMLFSAIGAGVNLGGTMMKDKTNQNAAQAPAMQPIVNNYYMSSNDNLQHQLAQQYAGEDDQYKVEEFDELEEPEGYQFQQQIQYDGNGDTPGFSHQSTWSSQFEPAQQ